MKKSGFVFVEMLAVIVNIAILVSAMLAGISKARLASWRTQSRDKARQLADAWVLYILEERSFPDKLVKNGADNENLKFDATNLGYLNGSGRIYYDATKEESKKGEVGGVRDHWGHFFFFSLDTNYDGEINNPAYVDDEHVKGTAFSSKKVMASAIVWSIADTLDKNYKEPKTHYLVSW